MALGLLGQFVVSLVKGIAAIKWWALILIILGLMLVISLPSVFITWRKLRRRDLGPVLNANGWAINAAAYVKPKFGKDLTQLVKYPKLEAVDPEARKKARRRRCITWIIVILLLGGGGYWGWTKYQACKAAKAEAAAVEAVDENATENAETETVPAEEVATETAE
jgi:hypothetical protein